MPHHTTPHRIAALSTILLVRTIVLYLVYERMLGIDRIYGKEDR